MADKSLKVVISSTVLDLPEYRKAAMDACLERNVHPKMMEHMTALNAAAIKASLDLVDQADVYLGIFAHRYGYIPDEDNPLKISITEMEYNRAVEFDTPRLIFLIKENYPFDPSFVDKGKEATKLKRLKKRLAKERVVKIFTSPEDLRGHIVSALADLEKALEPEESSSSIDSIGDRTIPKPPGEYIAHPYLLLQTPELIGRRAELAVLNEWVSERNSDIYQRNILSFVAIGGLGKSALTWQWFNKLAPEQMKPLAGRMWWSFYDPNADFENFVLQALSYVADIPVEVIRDKVSLPERETKLLAALNQKPFLIVFDGFERVLNAYSRAKDATRIEDSDVELPGNARKTADPRVGQFLKKLAQVKTSRILISSRLLPAELETDTGHPIPGVASHDLESLPDDEAVEMWQKLGVQGPRKVLLPVFRSFGKHALVIQALAGEVVKYRRGPGNFEKWLEANPTFDLTKFDNVRDKVEHVLEFALRGLSEKQRTVLATIIAFRVLPDYDTIAAVLVGDDKPFKDERKLDTALTEFEDRGLVGWDKRANRYDLHPIVRGVVWESLSEAIKQVVYTSIYNHFETVPMIEDWRLIESIDDLTPAIEMYCALIGLGQYDDACALFYSRLERATLHRLRASRQRVELLEMLFPDKLARMPPLSTNDSQGFALVALAIGYYGTGHLDRAGSLYSRAVVIYLKAGVTTSLHVTLSNLSETLAMTGNLYESEKTVRRALVTVQGFYPFSEAISLQQLGVLLAQRTESPEIVMQRSLRIFIDKGITQGEGRINACMAQIKIWFGEFAAALVLAARAWELAQVEKLEADLIFAARILGEASLGSDDSVTAEEKLNDALTRARAVKLVQEELPALIALAELRRRQGDEKAAREFLDDVWEFAERGPYPLYHADALNVLAQIERDAGNTDKAIEAATKAYELSWCDGPPFAYHWGLIKAQKHLEELGAPLPEMPAFEESKYEPMPEVEIDPEDEFHESS